MIEKVYCRGCRYFRYAYRDEDCKCKHEANWKLSSTAVESYYREAWCVSVNHKNDCKLFEPKKPWWRFW